MRKFLLSAVGVALLAFPATLAFAADNPETQGESSIAAGFPLSKAEPLDLAQADVERAAEKVDQRQDEIRERRGDRRESAETASAASGPASAQLQSIAECESGGDYSTNTGNGFYGAYQFTPETWASVGGSGLPSEAPPAEQDMRAQMLLDQSGTSPWPVCG